MASLVHFLAAGVKGAESGSATFVLRGLSSSAANWLYNDFEETTQPGTNVITLDANGAAEVYCSLNVDVTIRNSAGTILRTVTVGDSAGTIDVRSSSFRGTDYDGNPSNTLGQPISLLQIFDNWIQSAGAPGWAVDVNGTDMQLDEAFATFAGLFVNVKGPDYGAVGDGVTDDTAAVAAAIDDAGTGGIVYFPPGTYVLANLTVTAASFTLMGCGPSVSILKATGTTLLNLTSATTNVWKAFVGLGFTSAATPNRYIDINTNQNVSIRDCEFDCTNVAVEALNIDTTGARVIVDGCRFRLGTGTDFAIHSSGTDDSSAISVDNCFFTIPATFTGTVIRGVGFNVANSTFDASAVTSGAYYMVDAEHQSLAGTYLGVVTGNTFIDGGSSGYVFNLTEVDSSSDFTEDNNSFIGFPEPTALTDPGHIYDYSNAAGIDPTSRISLGSRKGKQLNFSNSGSATLSGTRANLVAERIHIEHTNASNLQVSFSPGEMPNGLDWLIIVHNNSGGARNIVFSGTSQSTSTHTLSALPDGSYGFGHFFSFQQGTGNMVTAVVGVNRTD